MSKNVTIARLNTLITANAAQFSKEMDRASSVAKSRGKSINDALSMVGGTLGVGLSVGAATAFGKSIIDMGSQVVDLSSFADMSARSFQTLSVLAGDSGVKMEEVAKASETMRQRLQDAKENAADPLNEGLRKLHLTAAGMSALTTDQKWQVIAERLVHAKDQQEAMNIATDIFGAKVAPKLRSALAEVAGGLDRASMGMGGMILSDEQLRRLDRFGDSLDRMGRFAKIFAVNLFDSKVGFDTMWNDIQSMSGKRPQIGATDIRTPGEYVLPGSKFTPANARDELEGKMRAAQQKQWADDEKKYREELAQIQRRHEERQRDPRYWLKQRGDQERQRNDLVELVLGKSETMRGLRADMAQRSRPDLDLNVPTDAFARIGLMTGVKVSPEQKVQTEHLKQIDDTLKKIRTLLANPTGQNLAAYAN